MLHAVAGKDRQLLTAHQRCKRIDGGNAGLNVVFRIFTRNGIDGSAVDIAHGLGIDLAEPVDGTAESVEHAT